MTAPTTMADTQVEVTLNVKPFNYDTFHPLALLAAKLVSEYYYALIEAKLPSVVIDNLVYDFHRIVWSMPPE